ncbi:DUF2067 family protein [Thermococcus gammatolerans]|uniref:DUF2067 domain-containing protein n=1 Tax=Thermococcus gammatolerans (strain DSM 15229 / JCM 11827 / EJ3) TaxID=593117 RepID=C5A5J4_THEGJ|nr:DUF2067 family protein [Thermococcus gammatolerans]ACS33506.1 Conserved hypothetical protein [Thermococcus gammatolerans EJ3]
MRAKRVITIHVRDDREKEEFMKELQRLSLPAFIYVHGKLDSIKVNVQGTKEEIREAIAKIRAIHNRVRAKLYPDRRGLYHYSPDDVFREAGTSVSLPIILKTLELLGERAEVDEAKGELVTSLPWDEIVELVRRLGLTLSEIALQTTRQIREVVLPVSVAFDMDPQEVLELLVDLGLAEWKEDKFKYELVKNKEQALEEVLKRLRGDADED